MLTNLIIVACIAYVAYGSGKVIGMLIFLMPWRDLLQDIGVSKQCRSCSARELCEAEQRRRAWERKT